MAPKLKVEIRETITLKNKNKYDAYNRFTLDDINYVDKSFTNVVVNNASLSGSGANFNILRDGTLSDSSIGNYTISGGNPGSGYGVGNRLLINGGTVGGVPSTHDITIQVSSIDSAGAIVTYVATGDVTTITAKASGSSNEYTGDTSGSVHNVDMEIFVAAV